MSKRKAHEISAETKSGGDGATRGSTGDAMAPAPEPSGWSGLPPELVQRVGQLQDDPKSIAGMERTCKAWRKVVMEGNDGIDMGGKPCIWRDLALAKFPRLRSIVEAARKRSTQTTAPESKHSWKALYRVNADAHRLSHQRVGTGSYWPKTSWDDYFLNVEFRRGGHLLFAASGEGDRTSPLWEQETEVDDSGRVVCKGHLDPNLKSRLGSNPFDEDSLQHIIARVFITRLSDMGVVELGELFFNDEGYDLEDRGGDLLWGGVYQRREFYHRREFLPVGTSTSLDSNKPIHTYSNTLRMKLWFESRNGTVVLEFEEKGHDYASEWKRVGTAKELAYLEMHCPWPETS